MRKEDCFLLGKISRKHGIKGDVVARLDTDYPERYQKLESVLVDLHGGLVPFFIHQSKLVNADHLLMNIEGVNTQDEAQSLMGAEIYLPLSALPKLEGNQFYFHEVTGFQAIDKSLGNLGFIQGIIEQPAQSIFDILDGETQIFVPIVDHFIESIDREHRIVYLQTPEGLIDLYRS